MSNFGAAKFEVQTFKDEVQTVLFKDPILTAQ